jgi:hypothetical protein
MGEKELVRNLKDLFEKESLSGLKKYLFMLTWLLKDLKRYGSSGGKAKFLLEWGWI